MNVALLLTLLGLAGVAAGVSLGQSRVFSTYLAAAGGGVLFGISVFWLIPEVAAASGWPAASAMTVAACLFLIFIDQIFVHAYPSSGHAAVWPVLAATAVHSFLDGWSVRALQSLQVASISAPLGLALHKVPEGLAIGWLARRGLRSPWQALAAAAAVELFTVVGALTEPAATRSGVAAFGAWWTSGIVAMIGGSFLFFAFHAIMPNRRRTGALVVFAATLLLVGTASLVKSGSL